jgi:hypothetical protein
MTEEDRRATARLVHRDPPPPHDPSERALITRIETWEARDFAVDDPKRQYFLRHGFAHAQLWHPIARVSLLTPSRLTARQYEAFPVSGWKYRHAHWPALRASILREHRVRLPALVELRALHRWLQRSVAIVDGHVT